MIIRYLLLANSYTLSCQIMARRPANTYSIFIIYPRKNVYRLPILEYYKSNCIILLIAFLFDGLIYLYNPLKSIKNKLSIPIFHIYLMNSNFVADIIYNTFFIIPSSLDSDKCVACYTMMSQHVLLTLCIDCTTIQCR